MTSIDVCVCTFRRNSLLATLQSIASQELHGVALRVIVADNDDDSRRQSDIEEAARQLGLDLRYVHAPARNISVARNACLGQASADWIAFIDDDEKADPDWLWRLLDETSDCDVVFGVAQAVYPANAPGWVVKGDFMSNRIDGNDAPWNGYTANVLIARAFVEQHQLRFDPALGQTGGEDTLFFLSAWKLGARFGYAPAAIVREPVSQHRLSLRWLLLRRYRSGQTHHLVMGHEGGRSMGTVLAAPKALVSLAGAAVTIVRPQLSSRFLLRAALHAGVLSAAFGLNRYREYGPKSRS